MLTNRFDDILKSLRTGRWNLLFFLCDAYCQLLNPFTYLSGVYLTPDVGHTCIPPDHPNVTGVSEDSCSYYVNTTTSDGNIERESYPCTDWVFDNSTYESTLTSEFKLVCGQAHMRATYQGLPMIAKFCTSILTGYLSDKYGRKTLIVPMQMIHAIVSLVIIFVPNMTYIMVFRFLQGACLSYGTYSLALEVCEVKWRAIVGVIIILPWSFGVMAWGGLAYLIRDWRMLQLAVSLPLFLKIGFFIFIDESPRWLILKGKEERAIQVLNKAARWNRAELPPEQQLKEIFQEMQLEENTEKGVKKEKKEFCDYVPTLLRTRKVRSRTMIISFTLCGSALVYTGLSLSGDIYNVDPFLYVVLGGVMDIPSNIVTGPLINWLGRKGPAIFCFAFCGIAVLALAFIPKDISWLILSLAMTGKLFNAMAFMVIFVYMNELLPTEVRLQGIGAIMTIDSVGNFLAPYVTDYLGPMVPWMPSVIFGLASLLTCFLLMPLPETKDQPMIETVEELEYGKKRILPKDDDGREEPKVYTAASS